MWCVRANMWWQFAWEIFIRINCVTVSTFHNFTHSIFEANEFRTGECAMFCNKTNRRKKILFSAAWRSTGGVRIIWLTVATNTMIFLQWIPQFDQIFMRRKSPSIETRHAPLKFTRHEPIEQLKPFKCKPSLNFINRSIFMVLLAQS